GQAVPDWAGGGSVRKLGVRFAGLVRLKDTVTCTGRVIAKSEKDDLRLVELDVWAENQKREKVVTGKATLALPSRAQSARAHAPGTTPTVWIRIFPSAAIIARSEFTPASEIRSSRANSAGVTSRRARRQSRISCSNPYHQSCIQHLTIAEYWMRYG